MSNNCDSLKNKVESLRCELKEAEATIFTLQETNFKTKGKVKIDNFVIFELIVVEVRTNKMQIRVITGYGPQE